MSSADLKLFPLVSKKGQIFSPCDRILRKNAIFICKFIPVFKSKDILYPIVLQVKNTCKTIDTSEKTLAPNGGNNSEKLQLNTAGLPPDIYLIQVNGTLVKQFVKY
ncbi:MAG: hypothetical protein H7257_11740 [Taibaiella sp.]|nr:hypothetical protein [Taibaiella sp.]